MKLREQDLHVCLNEHKINNLKGKERMNHAYFGSFKNISLRPLSVDDIELLRVWRNDKEQTKFLKPIEKITPDMQLNWYNSYLNNPQDIIFGIFETKDLNRVVGSLSIYDIKNGRAEIGKIQIGDPEAHGKGLGRISLVIAMKIGFELLGLGEIYASVHQDNAAARINDLRIGFKIVGCHQSPVGGLEDELTIHKEELYRVNRYTNEINVYIGEKR